MCNGNKIIKHTQKFCNYLARPFLCTLFVLATTAYALIALQSNLLILLIINIVFNHDSRLCGNLEILLQTVQVAHQMIHRSCDSNLHLSMLTLQGNNDRNDSHGILQNSWSSIDYWTLSLSLLVYFYIDKLNQRDQTWFQWKPWTILNDP